MLRTILLSIVACSFAIATEAADFRQPLSADEKDMGCSIVLEGEIERGDHQEFYRKVPQRQRGLLCLNSPGGAIGEALKIAADLADPTYNIGTAIAAKATCESACAIIFMFGKYATYFGGTAEYDVSDRRMHSSAILGFHAPVLPVSKLDRYSGKQVTEAFELGMEAVANLLHLRERMPDPIWSDALFMKMLRTPTDEMWRVTTVHEAVQLGIQIIGVNRQLNDQMEGVNLCISAFPPLDLDLEGTPPRRLSLIETDRNYAKFEFLSRGFGWSGSCEITLVNSSRAEGFDAPVRGDLVTLNIEYPRLGQVNRIFGQPNFAFYPPETQLSELPSTIPNDERNDPNQTSDVFLHLMAREMSLLTPSWCPNAKTDTERTICSDLQLSRIDNAISKVFNQLRQNRAARDLARERLSIRNGCGTDVPCLLRTTKQTLQLLETYLN